MNPVLSLTIALPILSLEIRRSIDIGVPELSRLQREGIACVMVRRQDVKDFQDQENAYIHTSEYMNMNMNISENNSLLS